MKGEFMAEAAALARRAVAEGGGPFGAVVVKGGEVIGRGMNRVTHDHDPTAHAEIMAIREACAALESHDLSGCELYASCEPCPMCLAAILWARLDRVYYAATAAHAAAAGFDDEAILEEVRRERGQRQLPLVRLAHPEARAAFADWEAKQDKVPY